MPTEYVSLAHVKHLPETAVLSATYTVAHAPCMLANRAASTSASESKPAELLRYKVCAVFEITRNPACLIQQKQQPRLFLRRRETHCTHAAAEKAQVLYLSSVSSERYFRFWRAALQLTCSGTIFAPVDHWLCCFGYQLWLLQIVNREFRFLLVGYHNSLSPPFCSRSGWLFARREEGTVTVRPVHVTRVLCCCDIVQGKVCLFLGACMSSLHACTSRSSWYVRSAILLQLALPSFGGVTSGDKTKLFQQISQPGVVHVRVQHILQTQQILVRNSAFG